MTDWNWFFSSLAQSAAALVGIVGAFIASKILSNQSTFAEKRHRARETLTTCRKVADSAGALAFDWYHEKVISAELAELESIYDVRHNLTPEDYFNRLDFPASISRSDAIERIKNQIEFRKEEIRREEDLERKRQEQREVGVPGFNLPPLEPPQLELPNMHNVAVTKEQEAIDRVYLEAKHQIRVVSDVIASIQGNPESSPQITGALGLVTMLFYCGVIYPLSFLPMAENVQINLTLIALWDILFSIRGAMLAAVTVVFSTLLIMFFLLNQRLRYEEHLIEDLRKYTSLSEYSSYFQAMWENEHSGVLRDG